MPSYSAKRREQEKKDTRSGASGRKAQDVLIAGRYRIQERLGGGAFGEVFKGMDVHSGHLVAMKMELTKDGHRSHLNMEHKIYKKFNECPVTVGIPESYFCGRVGDYTVMVMDLLGPCLEDLVSLCHHKLNPKTVCMLGIQIIQRLQYLHNVGYLHRDIKPENFVMGLGQHSHVLYVIDVGLSRTWRDSSGQHIPYVEGKSLTGTARYVSINTHLGIQQSRRDDLESVSYLLCYFLRGSLPWQGLKSPKKDAKFERIREVKAETKPADLVKGFPIQFGELVEYTRGLKFEEDPDYDYCTGLLMAALKSLGEEYDFRYQWLERDSTTESESGHATTATSGYTSRARTAVATGGGSSFLASSVFLADSEGGDRANKSAVNGSFLNDLGDVYGLNDYF